MGGGAQRLAGVPHQGHTAMWGVWGLSPDPGLPGWGFSTAPSSLPWCRLEKTVRQITAGLPACTRPAQQAPHDWAQLGKCRLREGRRPRVCRPSHEGAGSETRPRLRAVCPLQP